MLCTKGISGSCQVLREASMWWMGGGPDKWFILRKKYILCTGYFSWVFPHHVSIQYSPILNILYIERSNTPVHSSGQLYFKMYGRVTSERWGFEAVYKLFWKKKLNNLLHLSYNMGLIFQSQTWKYLHVLLKYLPLVIMLARAISITYKLSIIFIHICFCMCLCSSWVLLKEQGRRGPMRRCVRCMCLWHIHWKIVGSSRKLSSTIPKKLLYWRTSQLRYAIWIICV